MCFLWNQVSMEVVVGLTSHMLSEHLENKKNYPSTFTWLLPSFESKSVRSIDRESKSKVKQTIKTVFDSIRLVHVGILNYLAHLLQGMMNKNSSDVEFWLGASKRPALAPMGVCHGKATPRLCSISHCIILTLEYSNINHLAAILPNISTGIIKLATET